jgi:hypothetical protein
VQQDDRQRRDAQEQVKEVLGDAERERWTTMVQAIVEDIPPIRTPSGRRRTRPGKLHADKGVRHEALCDRVG